MLKLDPPDWGYFGTGFSIVAVGLGFTVMSSYQLIGNLLVALGLLMMLFSLRPTIRSLPWSQQRAERKQAAAREQAAAEEAAALATEQVRLRPILAAWDRFHAKAGKVVSLFYELAGAGGMPPALVSPEERRDAIMAAWERAKHLEEDPSTMAKAYLERLGALAPEGIDAGYIVAIDFNHWLLMRNADYMMLRDRAGLPRADYGGVKT